MLQQKTKKLFYGKWPFKIQCRMPGASRIPHYGVNAVELWCKGKGTLIGWLSDKNIDKPQLLKFTKAIRPFIDQDIKIRGDGYHFSVYCKDIKLWGEIKEKLNPWTTVICEPSTNEELCFLIDNGRKKLICSKYPHNGYRFRIHLDRETPSRIKENFAQWIPKYPEKMKFPKSTTTWLNELKYSWTNPYFYIIDEKMLSMVLLYMGSHCKLVEEFILDTSINS